MKELQVFFSPFNAIVLKVVKLLIKVMGGKQVFIRETS